MTPPRLTEVALFTGDVDGVTAFYERMLGIEPTERSAQQAVFALGELVLRVHIAVAQTPGDPPAVEESREANASVVDAGSEQRLRLSRREVGDDELGGRSLGRLPSPRGRRRAQLRTSGG